MAECRRTLPALDALAEFSSEADHQESAAPLKGPWDTPPARVVMPLAGASLAVRYKSTRGGGNEVEALSTAIQDLRVWIICLTVLVGASIVVVFALLFKLTNIVQGG